LLRARHRSEDAAFAECLLFLRVIRCRSKNRHNVPIPTGRTPLRQQHLQLYQRDIILRFDRTEDEGCMRVDPARTTVPPCGLAAGVPC
jgi:hypothetical protein